MSFCESRVSCLLLYTAGLVLSVAGCAFIAVVVYIHHQHRKYAHIPSPPRDNFFVGHLPMMMKYKRSGQAIAIAIVDLTQEYGPVFCFFVGHHVMVQCSDPGAVKDLLLGSAHRKPWWTYQAFQQIFGSRFLGGGLVSQLDPDVHAKRRGLFNPMFTRKYLVTFVNQFNASADALIEKLTKKADGKTEVIMLDEFNKTTLDVIAKVAFSLDIGASLDDNAPFNKAISMAVNGMASTLQSLTVMWNPFARAYRQKVRDSISFLRQTGRQCIEERLRAISEGDEVPQDILTHFLEDYLKQEGADDQVQIDDLIDEFVTLFFAGQETTANLLSFCLVELGHHPEIMHRLQTEVAAVLGDKDHIEPSDVNKLSYMMLVLKETLRLWPPVTGTMRQLAHEVTVRGYQIPKGTTVSLNSFVMSRMEEYFHDASHFDPDRFKTNDDKPHYAYFPFSLGTRNCIGQQFAVLESRVLLARLLAKFRFELVPGQGYDINDEITLKPLKGCRNYIQLVNDS